MGGLRGGDGMKVEKKQIQCQELCLSFLIRKKELNVLVLMWREEGIKWTLLKCFKNIWEKEKKPPELKVPYYAIFTLQVFSNYIIRLQPVSEIAQKCPFSTTFACSTFLTLTTF